MEVVRQKKQRKPKSPIDYANGKIYMIEPTCEYEEGEVYYGSCATELYKRFYTHNNKSNNCKSKILFDKYGKDNIKIVLVKLFPCSSKEELEAEEGKYHRQFKCVNKNRAMRTEEELNEYQKNYRKQYYAKQENKEQISVKKKQYYQEHKQELINYQKQYYAKQKEIANQQKHLNELEQEAEQLFEKQRINEILNESDNESDNYSE